MVKTTPFFIFTITLLSVGGLISTDLFLPALQQMSNDYQVSPAQMQNAIAIFLFAIALGQLIYGPLSDSMGRKKILLSGIFLWLITTIGVLYTSSFDQLLWLRFFQGIGACSGIVISRAIIADLLEKKEAGRIYLTIFPFVGASPAIAPLIGGELLHHFSWHSTFVFLAIFIVVTFFCVVFFLKETLAPDKRSRFQLSTLLQNIGIVLSNKKFIFYASVPCFAYAAYFAYIVESPFLLTQFGLNPALIGYSYIGLSLTYILGNITARKVTQKLPIEQAVRMGYLIFFAGSMLFLAQSYLSAHPLVVTLFSISVLTFGNGFLLPLGTALAIASHQKAAGTASGVMGALQLSSAALSSALIGKISHHDPHWVAILLAFLCVCGFISYMRGFKKHATN